MSLQIDKSRKFIGFISLIVATILWETSFVYIKLSIYSIDPFTYVFIRSFLATIFLLPLSFYKIIRKRLDLESIRGGLILGLVYSGGLLFQGAGTYYIDPSTSAFITGLSTVYVHIYSAFIRKRYNITDLVVLSTAVSGLYIMTRPSGGIGIGEILVLIGSFLWALEIILVSVYNRSSIIEFLFATSLAGTFYGIPLIDREIKIDTETLIYLIYLALVCSLTAILLQIYGRRHVSEKTAAVIFLLEPVFATIFSIASRLETAGLHKIIGGGLILT